MHRQFIYTYVNGTSLCSGTKNSPRLQSLNRVALDYFINIVMVLVSRGNDLEQIYTNIIKGRIGNQKNSDKDNIIVKKWR